MTAAVASARLRRLADGARVVAALVLGLPILLLGEHTSTAAWLTLVTIWLISAVAARLRTPGLIVFAAEAACAGVLVALSLDGFLAMLAALAVPPFVAGLHGGVRTALTAVLAEVTTLLTVHGYTSFGMTAEQATNTFMWALTGVGLGLIASYLHSDAARASADPLAPYRAAQSLIRELLDISGDLRSGLDPITLASRIAVEIRNALPVVAVAVHVPRGDKLTPLVAGSGASSVDRLLLDPVAHQAWKTRSIRVEDRLFALPLYTEAGTVAVVAGMLPARTDPSSLGLFERLATMAPGLAAMAVQLDTALLFGRLRDAATADERRRLARDLHDGVAQDIASLGYLVDSLAISPATPGQAESLRRLRQRITEVVAQVRLSVQTLRTDVEASESLGAAVGGLARHLSESSGIPIRVTVNERTSRLRPEVEAELLRIAQEAMTNAVRHAKPAVIDVSCRVAAPHAEIVVRDDGTGLGSARQDSYGLAIMQERADLIDADFTIEAAEPHGTVVTVRVPARHQGSSHAQAEQSGKVTV